MSNACLKRHCRENQAKKKNKKIPVNHKINLYYKNIAKVNKYLARFFFLGSGGERRGDKNRVPVTEI